jgi:hypothetical protein
MVGHVVPMSEGQKPHGPEKEAITGTIKDLGEGRISTAVIGRPTVRGDLEDVINC